MGGGGFERVVAAADRTAARPARREARPPEAAARTDARLATATAAPDAAHLTTLVDTVVRAAGGPRAAEPPRPTRIRAAPVVRRLPDPVQVRQIGGRLRLLVEALQADPTQLPARAAELVQLEADARAAGLHADNPRAYRTIDRLLAMAQAAPAATPQDVQAVLARFDPASVRPRDVAFGALTPELNPAGNGPDAGRTKPGRRRGALALAEANELAARHAGGDTSPGALVRARIDLTLRELATVYARFRADPRRNRTLLVFVGGEFWFRRADGPCTREERAEVIRAFQDASVLYPNVLIMPGTIVAGILVPGVGPDTGLWTGVHNTAPVFWNGRLVHQVDKASDAGTTDGIQGDRPGAAFLGKTPTGPSQFTLGAIRIAVDICADHDARRAQAEGERADLHLVTGWGQSVQAGKTALRPGGLAVSADSSGQGGSLWQRPGGGGNAIALGDGDVPAAGGGWQPATNFQDARNAPSQYWGPRPLPRRRRRRRRRPAVVYIGPGGADLGGEPGEGEPGEGE